MLVPRRAAIIAASAGLACISALASGQMPSFDVTNITWLQGQGYTGQGVDIGQMEGGTPASHVGFNTRNTIDAGAETRLHATHVAGILASDARFDQGQLYSGVATRGNLFSTGTTNFPAGTSRRNAAFDYLAGRSLAVVNMSFGTTRPNSLTTQADWLVGSKRQTVVVAADNSSSAGAAGPIGSPDDGYNVLTVGGTGRIRPDGSIDYRRLGTYSAVGPVGNGLHKPDLVAPGTRISSASSIDHDANGTLDDYRNSDFPAPNPDVTGCSFAAPHVAGSVALLQHAARGQGYQTQAANPAAVRAIMINSASKNVRDRDNNTWEQNWKTRASTAPLDPQLGSGLLDARRAYEQMAAGRANYGTTSGPGDAGGDFGYEMGVRGWDTSTIQAQYTYTYDASEAFRKGTYVTTTLAFERQTTGADAAGAAYSSALANLDLKLRDGVGGPLLSQSNSVGNSVEHILYKTAKRGLISIEFANPAGSATTTYGLAWYGYGAPTSVAAFNGDFSGDRGALIDNGWYAPTGATFGVAAPKPFVVPDPNPDAAANMVMCLGGAGSVGIAQELTQPGGFFTVNFSAAFDAPGQTLNVMLGTLLVGTVTADDGNSGSWQNYSLTYTNGGNLGMLPLFPELSFTFAGSGTTAYVDDITYIPTPGSLALAGLFGLVAARRRR